MVSSYRLGIESPGSDPKPAEAGWSVEQRASARLGVLAPEFILGRVAPVAGVRHGLQAVFISRRRY